MRFPWVASRNRIASPFWSTESLSAHWSVGVPRSQGRNFHFHCRGGAPDTEDALHKFVDAAIPIEDCEATAVAFALPLFASL